jgi:hypothetical protein
MGRDLERAGDHVRRQVARELRVIGPTIVRASESLATGLWREADVIDRSLRREGKRSSRQPPTNDRMRPA